jgi:hypothetical protein
MSAKPVEKHQAKMDAEDPLLGRMGLLKLLCKAVVGFF